MEFADGTRLSGKALIGWNAADQAIVYGGINSLGGLSLGTVEFDRAEKTLTLTSEGVEPDGTKTSFQGVIKRTDRHTYEWHATKRTGGPLEGPSPTYVFHRVTQPKPSTDAIPQQVQDELGFMVGQWKSVVTVNGQELPVASHTRRWAPGRHGLVFTWQGEEDGKPVWASGLSGWNPHTKEVVEHWYDSLGRYGSVRYPLDKMTATLWEGTTDRFYPDGTTGKGTCRLEKGDGRWVFTVTGEEGGEPVTVKEVSEKVE